MEYGVCTLSIVPVRKSTSDTAEIVTQLLFGERAKVLEKKDNWLYISCEWDHYEGWIDFKQLWILDEKTYQNLKQNGIANQFIQEISVDYEHVLIPMGASLSSYKNDSFDYFGMELPVSATDCNTIPTPNRIIEIAKRYLDVPYLWGGRSPFGIDCSGFSQIVYKFFNIRLPRDASQQVAFGKEISFLETTQPGDLVFFENENEKITHVGILISPNQVIHAHGKIRIDTINHQGIFNANLNKITHKLRMIKRIID